DSDSTGVQVEILTLYGKYDRPAVYTVTTSRSGNRTWKPSLTFLKCHFNLAQCDRPTKPDPPGFLKSTS
ncbi:hypothetical protein ON021_18595, partial [Microcoleus sp. HI-ES]|nr:hypothetical protein [Microcoleus sp. HI-ES]